MKNDYLIIGAGIIGLCVARSIRKHKPDARIIIIEKESHEACHASGRNSGVLHAGFYYPSDTLKAKFTLLGNKLMRDYCFLKNLPVNTCGKLVVAQDSKDLEMLYVLEKRGKQNGVNVQLISAEHASEIEANVRTYQHALFSPETATVDPRLICASIRQDLTAMGVQFHFDTAYVSHHENMVTTTQGDFLAGKIINCAGLYADRIAHDFGFGKNYTIVPFKGLYLKYTKNKTDVKMNIYPVPNLQNPFLGVHFTKTVNDEIKIGPTAIPALWRENYDFSSDFKGGEFMQILWEETKLFAANSFGFRDLALEEMKKYDKRYFIGLAQNLVQDIDPKGFTEYTQAGIRAQLLDRKSNALVNDFLIEADENSIHILNAVSPAFTCSIPFADYVFEQYIRKR